MKPIYAWHFVGDTLRDGRPVPADGVTLVHDRPLRICVSGYHASLDPYDALQYAPGNTLCLVELGGKLIHQSDKLVAVERTIVKRIDAEELMRKFARQRALSVIHLWKPPQIVLDYLHTGDETKRDAAWSARAAAWSEEDAARAAAWSARDAARAAAWSAARAAAWSAARAAAGDAARAAAWSAARDASRTEFNNMVNDAFGL